MTIKNRLALPLCALALSATGGAQAATTISLASIMDADSFISESAFSGAYAQISQGDGSLGSVGALTGDNDGLYNLNDFGQPNPQMFGGVDLFPREQNFQVGSVTYDETQITGVGVETVQISSIDLSELYTPDPERTNPSPGTAPSVISDISDLAIGTWFFNAAGGISFGDLDANDTLTFTDGVLTSIDLEITTVFSVQSFDLIEFEGVFRISGNEIGYLINDFQFGSTLEANITGIVSAVVPVPPALLLFPSALAAFGALRRRRG
ncbi:MAG: VPLPA-CTERM sorting domain-containing protein [Pseudomonadota bacterium]